MAPQESATPAAQAADPSHAEARNRQFIASASAQYARYHRRAARLLVFIAVLILATALLLVPSVQIVLGGWLLGDAASTPDGIQPRAAPNQSPNIFPQFMTLFLAVAAGGIAYMASMMGMRRLENYDAQFSEFRSERQAFQDRFETRFNKLAEDTVLEMTEQLDSAIAQSRQSALDAVAEQSVEARAQMDETLQKIEAIHREISDRFQVLIDHPAATEALGATASVAEVRQKAEALFNEDNKGAMRTLILTVLENRDPGSGRLRSRGQSDDWFNLSAWLGRSREFDLALRISLAGLEQQGTIVLAGPYSLDRTAMGLDWTRDPASASETEDNPTELGAPNIDLFSHSLQYASKIGERMLVDDLLRLARTIPIEKRNWRYYQFVGEVLKERGEREALFALIAEYERRIPHDERPVGLKLDWYMHTNDAEAIERIAREWDSAGAPRRGSAVPLRLADYYLQKGDYEAVLHWTGQGLIGSSERQPNASIAALIVFRANAYDALCLAAAAERPVDREKSMRYYRLARAHYSSPLLGSGEGAYPGAPTVRLETLRLAMVDCGCLPPEEPPHVKPAARATPVRGPATAEMLQDVIQNAVRAFSADDEDAQDRALQALRDLDEDASTAALAFLEKAKTAPELDEAARTAVRRLLDRLTDDPAA